MPIRTPEADHAGDFAKGRLNRRSKTYFSRSRSDELNFKRESDAE